MIVLKNIEKEMLEGMYQRIKTQEFKTGHDHVTQVLKVCCHSAIILLKARFFIYKTKLVNN